MLCAIHIDSIFSIHLLHAIPDKQENRPHHASYKWCTAENWHSYAIIHGAIAPASIVFLCWIFIKFIKIRKMCNFGMHASIWMRLTSKNRKNSYRLTVKIWPRSERNHAKYWHFCLAHLKRGRGIFNTIFYGPTTFRPHQVAELLCMLANRMAYTFADGATKLKGMDAYIKAKRTFSQWKEYVYILFFVALP